MKLSDSPTAAATVGVVARLGEIESALAGLAGELVPERLPGHQLERVMDVLGRIERRSGGARLVLAKAAADAGAWKASGARSAADHLARRSGISLGEAKADLAASERLAKLKRARDAAVGGDLSKNKARAVAEGAAADPDAESDLVNTAEKEDLGAVRDKARKVRHRADQRSGSMARRRYLRRGLRTWTETDGEGQGIWNVPPEYQAAYAAALEPYRAEAFRLAREAGTRPSPEALMADALQLLCLDVLADHDLDAPDGFFDPACPDGPCVGENDQPADGRHDGTDTDPLRDDASGQNDQPANTGSSDPPVRPGSSTPSPSSNPSTPPGRRRGSERRFAERRRIGGNRRAPAQVVIRVDHDALVRGHVEGEETCEIPGIGPVPVSTAQRMAEDAVLRVVVTKGADVTAIATDRRYRPAPLEHSIEARDPVCVVPGCHARHHLHYHHLIPFAQGGPTSKDNGARVCPYHHDLITYCDWTLTGGPGHWQFDPP